MPKQKIENRGRNSNNKAQYLTNIEKLILNLLAQASYLDYEKLFLSKGKLMRDLKMVNNNYSFCKLRIPKLSEFMNLDKILVEEWFDSTNRMLERHIDSALRELEKQSLVLWNKEIAVAKIIPIAEINKGKLHKHTTIDKYNELIDNYDYHTSKDVLFDYREATEDEKRFILHAEKETLRELGCKRKSDVVAVGKWGIFKDKVNNILLEKENIAFYYKAYKIIFNKNHIIEETEEFDVFELNEIEEAVHEFKVNSGIIKRIESNAKKRHKKAKDDPNELDKEIISIRKQDDYIENTNMLSENLIQINAKDIRQSVREQKFNSKPFPF